MPQFKIYLPEDLFALAQSDRDGVRQLLKHYLTKKRDCDGKGICKINH